MRTAIGHNKVRGCVRVCGDAAGWGRVRGRGEIVGVQSSNVAEIV